MMRYDSRVPLNVARISIPTGPLYSDVFNDHLATGIIAIPNKRDGYLTTASISFGAYSVLIFSQNKEK